jgi:hypothetical protein
LLSKGDVQECYDLVKWWVTVVDRDGRQGWNSDPRLFSEDWVSWVSFPRDQCLDEDLTCVLGEFKKRCSTILSKYSNDVVYEYI